MKHLITVGPFGWVQYAPALPGLLATVMSLSLVCVIENTPELYKELLENEKKNFHLVRSAARDLGGIPDMIHLADMSNTIPDEKVSE